jgi:hypothetical protein
MGRSNYRNASSLILRHSHGELIEQESRRLDVYTRIELQVNEMRSIHASFRVPSIDRASPSATGKATPITPFPSPP